MSSFRKPVRAFRYAAGTTTGGYIAGGTETEFSILASVQPLKPNEIQCLPEGRRNSKAFRLYSNTALQMLEGTNAKPDQVLLFGERYEVIGHGPWQNDVINHNKYIVVKVNGNVN